MSLSRRAAVLGAAASLLGGGSVWARDRRRVLKLVHSITKERLEAAYFVDGRYDGDAMLRIAALLRDRTNKRTHRIDTRLVDLMYALQRKLGGGPLVVTSGYRHLITNTRAHREDASFAKDSFHMSGRAVDIALGTGALERARDAAQALRRGGVGYYPDANYLHLDTGPVRAWSG